MDNIMLYLLTVIQEQYKTICWLLNLICRYIPLKQWAFDDSCSPKYQKPSTDHLPVIKSFIKQDWQLLIEYFLWKYGKTIRPVQRRKGKYLDSPPKNASSLKFSRHNAHIMSLCLTMHVNLQLFLRKTAQALNDLYGILISHQQAANYARTAAMVITMMLSPGSFVLS